MMCISSQYLQISYLKDLSEFLFHLITTAATIIGGFWVLKTYFIERPHAPNLTLNLDASAFKINDQTLLLQLEATYTNSGKGLFKAEDCWRRDGDHRTCIKVFAIKKSDDIKPNSTDECIDWEKNPIGELLYNSWFPDSPRIYQEVGETEKASLTLLISNDYTAIYAWLKIWKEDKDVPFFWSTSKVFSISKILDNKLLKIENEQ
jgi:hypothetical protein